MLVSEVREWGAGRDSPTATQHRAGASAGISGWWQNGSTYPQLWGWAQAGWWICSQGWLAGAAHNSSLQPETAAFASDSGRRRIWPPRLLSHSNFCHLGHSPWTWMQGFSLETSFLGHWESNLKTGKLLHLILVRGQVVCLDNVCFCGPPKPHTPGFWLSLVADGSVDYLSKN